MLNARPGLSLHGTAWQVGTLLAAGFLILVGIVFQLAQFGYDGLAAKNLWFISMIAENIWNFLAVRSDLPALGELLRFWPLLLVASGLGLLAIRYSACAARLSVSQVRITDRD
ncbi:MAG: hypothetical protein ACRD5K_15500 [Candidatus Acidiferrales bacterium]